MTTLLIDCGSLTHAAALGILVGDAHGRLELLSATSHNAGEIELYQVQHDTGPCLDTVRTGQQVYVSDPAEIVRRWGKVGEAITGEGFSQVHTSPLRWHGETFGALNAFPRDTSPLDEALLNLSQAFADMAAAVIVQGTAVAADQIADRITAALRGRIVIEQAKGVLAELHDLDMEQAYRMLTTLPAADPGDTLTAIAKRVVRQAARRRD